MEEPASFPGGARVALSLSFDDARDSQLDVGVPLLDEYDALATFYVLPARVRQRCDRWKAALEGGHEIGNHTATHPCSGNFGFSQNNALEDYTAERMEAEIDRASARIEELLGVRPVTFAYPCGQSFLGRGETRTSYVPLVARRFIAARAYGSETSNDPQRCDLAHLEAFTIDDLDGDALVRLVDGESKERAWIIMAGHDVGDGGEQTVKVDALRALLRRAGEDDVWLAPIAEVATHLKRAA